MFKLKNLTAKYGMPDFLTGEIYHVRQRMGKKTPRKNRGENFVARTGIEPVIPP